MSDKPHCYYYTRCAYCNSITAFYVRMTGKKETHLEDYHKFLENSQVDKTLKECLFCGKTTVHKFIGADSDVTIPIRKGTA